jgi:hypothetical protein
LGADGCKEKRNEHTRYDLSNSVHWVTVRVLGIGGHDTYSPCLAGWQLFAALVVRQQNLNPTNCYDCGE